MTEAELEEGRRLLEVDNEARGLLPKAQSQASLIDWFWAHRHALLARREEIAREAVREFGDVLFSNRVEVEDGRCSVIYEWRLVKEAKERGVTLGDKP